MTTDAPRESNDEWAARVSRAVRSGSRDALAEIYDSCAWELVEAIARITRRDESFALDCMQEMFMRLAANPPLVNTHAALIAWMRVTALNVARTTIVTESRRHRRENANSMHELQELQESDAQTRDALDRIVQCLSEDERALLRLRHVEGMLIRSIAVALGATPPAIESALRRIVARLRSGGAS